MVACIVGYNIVEKLPVMQHYKRLKTTTIESNHLLDDSHADNENEAVVQKSGNAGNLDRKEIVYYLPIWKKIQGPALAVAFIYVVTLSIFPGHITEDLQSTFFGDWYAVLLVLDYNLADLIGKCLASVNPFMTENKIIAIGGSLGRVVFYLLFYLCLHGPSFFQGDVVVIVITGLLGLTNGYFTTILMVLAPKSVPLEEAEVAAFLMVIFLILGLGAGSALEWIWVL
jgi:equilibrative nucleoside transporter 1/2/3